MKVQCKVCHKLHVDGEWTDQRADKRTNMYTSCPNCFDEFMKTPLDPVSDMGIALVAR